MILAGQTVGFDASASIDPDGYPLHYEWDFGDGFGASGWELNQVSHTYYSQGLYQATVTVTVGLRDQDTTSATISVAPAIIVDASPVGMNGIRWFGPDRDLNFNACRIAFLIAVEASNFLAPDEQVINLSGAGVILSAHLSRNDGGGPSASLPMMTLACACGPSLPQAIQALSEARQL